MFENTIKALEEYNSIVEKHNNSQDDEYKKYCAELDISKALTHDLGYGVASNIARGMLILDPLNNILK